MTPAPAPIRAGDWRTVLADVDQCDAVICDPPYGERVHRGHDGAGDQVRSVTGQRTRRALGYAHWTPDDVHEFVESWSPRCRGWIVALTSHDLIPAWGSAYQAAGRYAFSPIPCRVRYIPRLLGDGPSSGWVYAMVSRPRTRAAMCWGVLPDSYRDGPTERCARVGGKPLWMMLQIVRDYSRPGDLVVDPCAGDGTTVLAALLQGREGRGAEIDAEVAAAANRRIERETAQGDLFVARPEKTKQKDLDFGA